MKYLVLSLALCLLLPACSSPAPEAAPGAAAPTDAPAAAPGGGEVAPAGTGSPPAPDVSAGPSFDCAAAASEAEKQVCADPALAALDRQLADVYSAALASASDEGLAATQRGWIKGRDECWKADDGPRCVREAYQTRIVDLTINYGGILIPDAVGYRCDDPSRPFYATYYDDTDPRAAVLTWGDDQVIVFPESTDRGRRYGREGVAFEEYEGEVSVDFFGTALRCEVIP